MPIFATVGEVMPYQAVDPRNVKALRIAVASAIRSPSNIRRALGTCSIHLRKIQSPIHPARQLRHINIVANLLIQQLHHLIRLLVLGEQVHARANPIILRSVKQVLTHGQRGPPCQDTDASVVDALEGAVLRAGGLVGADGGVEGLRAARDVHVVDGVEGSRQGVRDE